MKPTKIWLTYYPAQQKWLCSLPSPSLKGLKKGRSIYAAIGADNHKVKLPIQSLTQNNRSTHLRFSVLLSKHASAFKAGPFIGILAADGRGGKPFKGNAQNFIDLQRTARRLGGMVYVFTPSGTHLAEGKTRGYFYDETQKRWLSTNMPLPDVVYNRVSTRQDEKKPQMQRLMKELQKRNHVTFFNPGFFNKLQLYALLSKTEHQSLVPETQALTEFQHLASFLEKHPAVYLKPVDGKAGAGMVRIDRKTSGRGVAYCLRHYRGSDTKTLKTGRLQSFWPLIKNDIQTNPYIIQAAFPLADYQGRPFDLRVLVQKNGAGEWQITGIGTRVAGKESFTTHVPRGGSIARTGEVLTAVFGDEQAQQLIQKVSQKAVSIAGTLEQHLGHMGEMSMDIGISPTGELAFFEANSKPMKFDEPDIRRLSLERLIQYAQYATFNMRVPKAVTAF